MTKIRTEILLDTVAFNSGKIIEARLLINNFFTATHFLYFEGENLYDEGIDGEERKLRKNDFLNEYQNNYWLIDNMV